MIFKLNWLKVKHANKNPSKKSLNIEKHKQTNGEKTNIQIDAHTHTNRHTNGEKTNIQTNKQTEKTVLIEISSHQKLNSWNLNSSSDFILNATDKTEPPDIREEIKGLIFRRSGKLKSTHPGKLQQLQIVDCGCHNPWAAAIHENIRDLVDSVSCIAACTNLKVLYCGASKPTSAPPQSTSWTSWIAAHALRQVPSNL